MLNEQDRYLSFTLSGTALDNLTGAPDDAFEVALLDANTGLSVLGSNGLTRTDSFLNLQGDGTQHASDCVSCTWNADGSRTYRVDLSGVAKGTAVNLSFDLLGFGQDNSHVTLSDIRVSGLPQLHDDAATLAEDNLLTFDPYAQADSQLKPLLASHIVDAPTHGVLTVNADGTFAYTPEANYFGADSFSYRLSDGPLDSNLATVNLTVTAVNDAPVAADVAVTTAEDTALVIDLYAYATDVDTMLPSTSGGRGAGGEGSFTTTIVTGPAHGVLTQNADGTYSYTPVVNYNGADSFTYRVNDGTLDSNIATVTLAITSVNDAPQGMSTTVTTLEDTDYVFQLVDFGYSDVNDTPANNFSAVTISSLPIAGILTNNGFAVVAGQSISVADIALGLLKFAPAFNANGACYANFTFQVQDDDGVANGGVDIDQTARTMTVNVTAMNDAPVAVDTQAATDEDTPLNLNLLAAASDVDGDVLSPVIIAGPLHGQLVRNADGTFNYVSDLNYFGTDSFTYKVSDGDPMAGGLESNIVTVSLTINAVNDAPVAVSATVTGTEDTPYIFTWSDFRVSDVDSTDLAITINTLPADGLLQHYDGIQWIAVAEGQRVTRTDIDAGLLCFGPDVNESGFAGYSIAGSGNNLQNYASFTYQADDGFLSSAVASMTVNIIPVADAPALALAGEVDAYGATALRFSTGWEIAPNRNPTFTILPQSSLDGWNVVRETGDTGQQAFVIWSSGDKMKDANNTNRIVTVRPALSPTLSRRRARGRTRKAIFNPRARTGWSWAIRWAMATRHGASSAQSIPAQAWLIT
ncbi:MAG: hypothetical protein A3H31_01020 [Gallionellales bacterium RIFCSPLOWO2_02_FULL_57_47]|nr:MAG: hypothetical protein A3H31_01020 [Gallionellales bacterium RIFCSPLOWO2_02_FULL_57_47]